MGTTFENPTDPTGSVRAIASNASTLIAMRTMASPLLPGRDGDALPPLPFASRQLAALVVVAGRYPVPRGLMAHVAVGTGTGAYAVPDRTHDHQRSYDDRGAHVTPDCTA